MADTPGMRVYEIRRALGPDPRHEMPQRAFAELVNAKAVELGVDVTFDSSAITRIEKGDRRLQLEEVPVFAALDPLHRGDMWLAWGTAYSSPPADAKRVAESMTRAEEAGAKRLPPEEFKPATTRTEKGTGRGKGKRAG